MSLLKIIELESQLDRRDEYIMELENKLKSKTEDEINSNRYKWLRQHHVDSSYNIKIGKNDRTTINWLGGSYEELDDHIDYAMQPGVESK